MNDRPTAGELLDAVRLFLEKELLPTLTDARLRFQTLVAVHVLGIAHRELADEQEKGAEEWRLLGSGEPPTRLSALRAGVRERNRLLCEAIREGKFDHPPGMEELLKILRILTVNKLAITNPGYRPVRTPSGEP